MLGAMVAENDDVESRVKDHQKIIFDLKNHFFPD
jgi:hypothetical protein